MDKYGETAMSMKMKNDAIYSSDPMISLHPEHLAQERAKVTGAIILIASGIVFFLAQSGVIDWGSPWWTIYIGIPGLSLIWGAYACYRRTGAASPAARAELVGGIVALAVAVIFLIDPHWSFTRNLFRGWDAPILNWINWDSVWRWLLVLIGGAVIYSGVRTRHQGQMVFGSILVVVGFTFILNISWNAVWPLAIVAAGVALLFGNRRSA